MSVPGNTVFEKIKIYLEMIKFEHSVFALPFAYVGAFLARMRAPTWWALFWITVAMVGARSFAMSLNRYIDREIDARNPRTAKRALPQRLLSERDVILFALVSLVTFLVAVYQLAPICRYLWPIVVIPFVIYPYTKRFTWFNHFLLGVCLGLAPLGAWVAVTNSVALVPFVLGLGVTFWTAGFDIIYACQDVEVDREHNLFSIPARFGIKAGLSTTKILHLLSILVFSFAGYLLQLGFIYYLGIFVVALLLAYENSLVKANDLSRLNLAFFTMNGVISIIFFVFTAVEVVI